MIIERTVVVDRPVADVYRYLSDFTTSTEWDPGTVRTSLKSGDGAVGSVYHNESRFLGRKVELDYVLTTLEPEQTVALRGENAGVVARDTMTMATTASGGTEVRYRADFQFKGLARLLAPLTGRAVRKLGDDAAIQLESALLRL